MPFQIVLGDITKQHVDAIVNAANNSLLGGGGVDGAIHRAAGPDLLKECRTLHGCETGEAKITRGYDLPAKFVIHTVGPIWRGGLFHEEELLRSAYSNSLKLAQQNRCESVAFPLISAGVYGYPLEQAKAIAIDEIRKFLNEYEMDIYLVIFSRESYRIDQVLFKEIDQEIRKNSGQENPSLKKEVIFGSMMHSLQSRRKSVRRDADASASEICEDAAIPQVPKSLQDALTNLDESFSQSLLRLIDMKGMTDAECYKKANIDRKLFSKIRSDIQYRPSKQTVLAFAVALELDLKETEALLKKAGFALSHANKADVIVEYFISRKNYDMYTINEVLFAFDQNLLGA